MSDEYHLPCKNIYEMHAEFNSLKDIAIQELEQDLKEAREDVNAEASFALDPHDQLAKIITDAPSMGIPLAFFTKNSTLMSDKHASIQSAILTALGVHVANTKINHYISWNLYLKINALIKFHCAPKQDYIDFWLKFLNPIGRKLLNK